MTPRSHRQMIAPLPRHITAPQLAAMIRNLETHGVVTAREADKMRGRL